MSFQTIIEKKNVSRGRPNQTRIRKANENLNPMNKTVDEQAESDYEGNEGKRKVI